MFGLKAKFKQSDGDANFMQNINKERNLKTILGNAKAYGQP